MESRVEKINFKINRMSFQIKNHGESLDSHKKNTLLYYTAVKDNAKRTNNIEKEVGFIRKDIAKLSGLESKISLFSESMQTLMNDHLKPLAEEQKKVLQLVHRNKLIVNGALFLFVLAISGLLNGLITWYFSKGAV